MRIPVKQDFAAMHVTRLRTDRDNAQACAPDQAQHRDTLQELDVVFNGHRLRDELVAAGIGHEN